MNYLVCTPRRLPPEKRIAAAKTATAINPLNHAPVERLAGVMPGFISSPERIAVVTTKYWGLQGVNLTVGFMVSTPTDLKKRLLLHMNAWAKTANVKFVETKTDPQVRIAFEGGANGGYWSYVGTDILHIPKNQQTLNLEAFTMQMPESEFHRVVRHETGHTLGFPHEHMRRALVKNSTLPRPLRTSSARRDGVRMKSVHRSLPPSKNQPCAAPRSMPGPSCATSSPAKLPSAVSRLSVAPILTQKTTALLL